MVKLPVSSKYFPFLQIRYIKQRPSTANSCGKQSFSVGDVVGIAVGVEMVGDRVGAKNVGALEGCGVGLGEGATVGLAVGRDVGDGVGDIVVVHFGTLHLSGHSTRRRAPKIFLPEQRVI